MDCVSFNSKIEDYLNDGLTDEELNDFIRHYRTCRDCEDELEINYIVREGMARLDEKHENFDLYAAYKKNIAESAVYIENRKKIIRLSYVVGTVVFWLVLCASFVFMRVMVKGY